MFVLYSTIWAFYFSLATEHALKWEYKFSLLTSRNVGEHGIWTWFLSHWPTRPPPLLIGCGSRAGKDGSYLNGYVKKSYFLFQTNMLTAMRNVLSFFGIFSISFTIGGMRHMSRISFKGFPYNITDGSIKSLIVEKTYSWKIFVISMIVREITTTVVI